jgi:hypothetical protein
MNPTLFTGGHSWKSILHESLNCLTVPSMTSQISKMYHVVAGMWASVLMCICEESEGARVFGTHEQMHMCTCVGRWMYLYMWVESGDWWIDTQKTPYGWSAACWTGGGSCQGNTGREVAQINSTLSSCPESQWTDQSPVGDRIFVCRVATNF